MLLADYLQEYAASSNSLPLGNVELAITARLADGSQLQFSHTIASSELVPRLRLLASSAPAVAAHQLSRVVGDARACRAEISKLHRQVNTLGRQVTRDLAATRCDALAAANAAATATPAAAGGKIARPITAAAMSAAPAATRGVGQVPPVGWLESCFTRRNGTPRQPGLAPAAASRLRVRWGTCPAHTLDGLGAFSHVWLLFVFDQNRGGPDVVKAKVKPPRLDGAPTGLFACRTPHRPNPIGLSLVRLERVEGDTLYFMGADLIDGTPILDIKPYIPYADAPRCTDSVRAPEWVEQGSHPRLHVIVSEEARAQLRAACAPTALQGTPAGAGADSRSLRFYAGRPDEAEAAIVQQLQADPRSTYRKHKCAGQEYRVSLDGLEASCTFESAVLENHGERAPAEIARVVGVRLEPVGTVAPTAGPGGAGRGGARASDDVDEVEAG